MSSRWSSISSWSIRAPRRKWEVEKGSGEGKSKQEAEKRGGGKREVGQGNPVKGIRERKPPKKKLNRFQYDTPGNAPVVRTGHRKREGERAEVDKEGREKVVEQGDRKSASLLSCTRLAMSLRRHVQRGEPEQRSRNGVVCTGEPERNSVSCVRTCDVDEERRIRIFVEFDFQMRSGNYSHGRRRCRLGSLLCLVTERKRGRNGMTHFMGLLPLLPQRTSKRSTERRKTGGPRAQKEHKSHRQASPQGACCG